MSNLTKRGASAPPTPGREWLAKAKEEQTA